MDLQNILAYIQVLVVEVVKIQAKVRYYNYIMGVVDTSLSSRPLPLTKINMPIFLQYSLSLFPVSVGNSCYSATGCSTAHSCSHSHCGWCVIGQDSIATDISTWQ